MADRDDIIRKVQALWAKADDAAATEPERDAAISKARDLMAKYTIDEMVLNEAKAAGDKEDVILMDIRITKEGDDLVSDQAIMLAHFIGTHNRCRQVIQTRGATVSSATGDPIDGGTFLTVCGYRSDCEMVRDLYRELAADMMLAVILEPTSHMGARDKKNYFANFCDGYAVRIDERLGEINKRVHEVAESTGSMALVLRSREHAVADTFEQMFPNLSTHRMSAVRRDVNAQERGAAAADKAELGQTKVGSRKDALGAGDG